MNLHPTAIVSPGAEVGDGCTIGPYTVIDEHVSIGPNCRIGPHVYVTGHTSIGEGTTIHTGAVVGDVPQDQHYAGEVTYTEIGSRCIIREYVTIHRGTEAGSKTTIGDHVMLMGFAHLGHNCHIGNQVVIANATLLAGHVEVGDRAFISGGVLVHQFVRIGTIAMIGGGNAIGQDVPPFCMLQYDQIQGPNVVGLRRAGISETARKAIRNAIKIYFFGGLSRLSALERIAEEAGSIPEVQAFVRFIEGTKRGVSPGRKTKARKTVDA
jgi:UDP-N-acetylglucosamine acyltransferase